MHTTDDALGQYRMRGCVRSKVDPCTWSVRVTTDVGLKRSSGSRSMRGMPSVLVRTTAVMVTRDFSLRHV